MDRRTFLHGSLALAASPLVTRLPSIRRQPPNIAQINPANIAKVAATQQCPAWCWAASASMVFGLFGHPIDQKSIVLRSYGGLVCAPAGNTSAMGMALSGPYKDANGTSFISQITAAYDYFNGINSLSNSMIIQELATQHPLLYCNKHHAMVVTAMSYYGSPAMPTVAQVGVIDPWPLGPLLHGLTPAEMTPVHMGGEMTFLARVLVT